MTTIGTPLVTADGSTIHPGARVWYHDADDAPQPASIHVHSGHAITIKQGSVSLSLRTGGFIELGPDRLFSDPIACCRSALKLTEESKP